MERRTKLRIVVGAIYGISILWGAFYQSIAEDPLTILATLVLGIGAGVISGGLLFTLIAMCPGEEKRKAAVSAHPGDYRAAA
jgi:hypothetical protein